MSAAVLGLLLRGTALLAAVFALERLLQRRSAALRHALWSAASAGLLVLPFVARIAPRIETPLPELSFAATSAVEPAVARAAEPEAARPFPPPPQARRAWSALATLVPLAWAAGAVGLVLLHVARRAALARWVRAGVALDDGAWSHRLALARAAVGLRRPVRLVASAAAPVPLALGWREPVILLPEAAATWDEERLASVLRHELVHARRADELTHTIAVLARALHWPNPLAWLAFRALVRAREQSCDDQVLATGVRPSVYAAHLVQAASELPLRPAPFAYASPALASAGDCAERVRAVLDARRSRASLAPRAFVLAIAAVAGLVVPLGALAGEPGALPRAQEIVALRDQALDEATLARLLDALADDRAVEPPAIPVRPSALRQGGLPETTPGKEAARVLVRHGSAAVDALLGALEDGHPSRREKAAWALGCIGERRTATALATLLARDPSADVRRIAAWALGEMRARSERTALEAALGDRAAPVRAQAAHSLGDLRDARAVSALLGVLGDPDASVRERAAHALGDIADRSAAAGMRALLDDRDADVRDMARWALREMGADQP